MGKYSRLVMASAIALTFQKLQAQNQFATIEKNHNLRAKGLSHELNTTKDTLILQSAKTIDYVYAINSEYKREIDFYNNTKELKIALNQLTRGKHVFVVGNQRMQIIFVVRIKKDNGDLALTSKGDVVISGN